jgi:hypothetical protein
MQEINQQSYIFSRTEVLDSRIDDGRYVYRQTANKSRKIGSESTDVPMPDGDPSRNRYHCVGHD